MTDHTPQQENWSVKRDQKLWSDYQDYLQNIVFYWQQRGIDEECIDDLMKESIMFFSQEAESISSERTRLLDEVRGLKEMKYEETYTPMGEKAARNQLRRKLLEALDTLGEK